MKAAPEYLRGASLAREHFADLNDRQAAEFIDHVARASYPRNVSQQISIKRGFWDQRKGLLKMPGR